MALDLQTDCPRPESALKLCAPIEYGTTFTFYLLTYRTLQVRCKEVDAVGRRCLWTGRRDKFVRHQHVFSQPAQTTPAHKRTAEENHDEAPPAKAASVDASTQTSSAAAGTAGVEENDSSSVRDAAASAPDRHQPGTDDDDDIRANTANDHEDSHGDEDHDETQA